MDPMNDIKLLIGYRIFEGGAWAEISRHLFDLKLSDIQCNERYSNILKEQLKMGPWSEEEDALLKEMI